MIVVNIITEIYDLTSLNFKLHANKRSADALGGSIIT